MNIVIKFLQLVSRSESKASKRLTASFCCLMLGALVNVQSKADDTQIYTGLDTRQCSSTEKYRFVFIVDNSGSMSTTEFVQTKGTIDSAILTVLASDLEDVQVSVMQYGTNHDWPNQHSYDVTVPFTSDPVIATNWSREFGQGSPNSRYFQDHLPGSLAEARLDNIYGRGGELDVTDGTNLQFVFFTDAWRTFGPTSCCSVLTVDSNDSFRQNALLGFDEYNVLKNGSLVRNSNGVGLEAQFTVLNTNTRTSARNAAAAIASVGGEYNGGVEANADDPDGSQTLPRRFISTSFSDPNLANKLVDLVTEVIDEIKADAFTQAAPAVTVNAFNQLVNRNELFYSLFDPALGPKWDGNIKGFTITSESEILSTNGSPAIDPATGSLSANARSFWSNGGYDQCVGDDLIGCTLNSDGSEASVGAFRENLTSDRTIYTQASTTKQALHVDGLPGGVIGSGTGEYFNGDGILKITKNSDIDERLLGIEVATDTFDAIQVDLPFTVTQGDAFSYLPTSGNLLYNDSGIGGNRWEQVAESDAFSNFAQDLFSPYNFKFTFGVPGDLIDEDSIEEGRIVMGLRSENEAASTSYQRATVSLFFPPNGRLRVRYRNDNGENVNQYVGRYNPFDEFSINVTPPGLAGGEYTFEFFQNGNLIHTVSNARTWDDQAIPPGSDFTAIGVGKSNNILRSDELAGFYSLEFEQEAKVDVVVPGQLTRADLLAWMTGEDVFNENIGGNGNGFVADSLHSRPRVITYGGTQQNPKDVLFHTTNLGMLHAVDPENGEELWSYVPAELLENAAKYVRDDEALEEHVYGLDGQLSTWIIRPPRTYGSSTIDSPLRVFLYMGQRRGGKSIYAFNATNALANNGTNAPGKANTCDDIGDGDAGDPICMLFPPIIGGTATNSTDGFEMLGQTWGLPQRIKVNTNDASFCSRIGADVPCKRDLLLITGGYDTQYDGVANTCNTVIGARATIKELEGCVVGAHLYMVDPFTGELVWSMGSVDPDINNAIYIECDENTAASDSDIPATGADKNGTCNDDMEHSFVSTPVTLDIDVDGAIDTIFANDISGKIWRIDLRLDEGDPDGSVVRLLEKTTAGIIADLAKDGNQDINRFFYNSLDVSLIFGSDIAGATTATPTRFNIVVGSGNRANPRNLVDTNEGNKFFVVFDKNIIKAPYDYSYVGDPTTGTTDTIDLFDLKDFTNAQAAADKFAELEYGAQFALDDNDEEKVLAPTITIDGLAIGVSYSPDLSRGNECTLGGSMLYTINLRTGEKRTFPLAQQGIVAEAVLLNLVDDNNTTTDLSDDKIERSICVGTECFKDEDLGLPSTSNIGRAIKTGWWEVIE